MSIYTDKADIEKFLGTGNALMIGMGLYAVNGEIILRVMTKEVLKASKGEMYTSEPNTATADFRLPGRPLCKGL
jgi:hypothetical protein